MSRLSTLHTQLTRRHTAHIYMPSHTYGTYAYEDSRKYHEIYGGFPICIACVHEFRVCSAQGSPLVSPASVMSVHVCVCVLIGIPVVLCVCVCVFALFMFMRVFTLLITLNEPHAICFHLWRRLFQTFSESTLGLGSVAVEY